MKKLSVILLSLLGASALQAASTMVDGVFYELNDKKHTAIVSYQGESAKMVENEYAGEVFVPSTFTIGALSYTVIAVGDEAFAGCKTVLQVSLPETVTEIGAKAFDGCTELMAVNFPAQLRKIGEKAFHNCSSLEQIIIPESMKEIGDNAFAGCKRVQAIEWNPQNCKISNSDSRAPFSDISGRITSFTFGNNVKVIPSNLCAGMSKLAAIQLPRKVTEIGDGAFANCTRLNAISLPSGLKKIGKAAFKNCSSLGQIVIPDGVKTISDEAFKGCSRLAAVQWNDNLSEIGSSAFENCSTLGICIFPEKLKTIKDKAFCGCSEIRTLIFPASIKKIGSKAFDGCISLATVTCHATKVPSMGKQAFGKDAILVPLHIPYAAMGDYNSDKSWAVFTTLQPIDQPE